MEIKPTYLTYQQSKILKEKGCDAKSNKGYYQHGTTQLVLRKDSEPIDSELCNAYEQWQIVEWLRINNNIIVYVEFITSPSNKFRPNIVTKDGEGLLSNHIILTNYCSYSPGEALSSAFDYVLKNLL